MALTILTGSSQAAATNYSYTTSGSSDWSSVPTSSNFYDVIDKVVRYKTADSQYVNTISASYAATASYMIGSITSASYAATASYVVGSIASASYSQTAETASIATSSSYAVSSSYARNSLSASSAATASHVNLVAGPNITINKTANAFEISSSAAPAGSSITWVTYAGSTPNYNIYLSSSYGYISQTGTFNGFLRLPASASLGDTFQYVGSLAGGGLGSLQIVQTRSNEQIYIDGIPTTLGGSGYLQFPTTTKQASYTFTCIQVGTPSTGHRWAITSFASADANVLGNITIA